MSTTNANLLILNKRCEFWIDAPNAAVPVVQCPANQLGDILDCVAADSVTVEFHTSSRPEAAKSDVKKYSKRLAAVADRWDRTDFAPKCVRGYALAEVLVCTLTRRTA
jgi:hypothetical protein